VSENARGTMRVLTGSLSWDLEGLELPCSLDDERGVEANLGGQLSVSGRRTRGITISEH